jgi:hypothetical protein
MLAAVSGKSLKAIWWIMEQPLEEGRRNSLLIYLALLDILRLFLKRGTELSYYWFHSINPVFHIAMEGHNALDPTIDHKKH